MDPAPIKYYYLYSFEQVSNSFAQPSKVQKNQDPKAAKLITIIEARPNFAFLTSMQ